jgi:7-cyano-7-deazaguanine synthase
MTELEEGPDPALPLAVLASGGLDSAVLLAESLHRHPAVHPLYVRFGLAWEPAELEHLGRFLSTLAGEALRPLVVLDMPAHDLYGAHWALTGKGVPGADTPDEAVYLPGRNVLLLAKALVWCHLHGAPALALGTLARNPFADATPAFLASYAALVDQALGGRVRVWRPYGGLSKADVVRRGAGLALEWALSCLRPVNGLHCGACNKCAERRQAFADAGAPDPTPYHRREHV